MEMKASELPREHNVKMLYVLYDANCEFCLACKQWLMGQTKHIRMVYANVHSKLLPAWMQDVVCREQEAARAAGEGARLLVISDRGGVYQGSKAFLMCLFALRSYRRLSYRLTNPLLQPMARAALEMVSRNRQAISRWMFHASDAELATALSAVPPPVAGDACGSRL